MPHSSSQNSSRDGSSSPDQAPGRLASRRAETGLPAETGSAEDSPAEDSSVETSFAESGLVEATLARAVSGSVLIVQVSENRDREVRGPEDGGPEAGGREAEPSEFSGPDKSPDHRPVVARIWGIDAPEPGQPFGEAAARAARQFCEGRRLRVAVRTGGALSQHLTRQYLGEDRTQETAASKDDSIGDTSSEDSSSVDFSSGDSSAVSPKPGVPVPDIYVTGSIVAVGSSTNGSSSKKDVGRALVRRGLAWQDQRGPSSAQLRSLEMKARRQETGLWEQASPTPPWAWRD